MERITVALLIVFTTVNLAFVGPRTDKWDSVNTTSTIDWQGSKKLTWNDFKGHPKNWGSISALTASAIEYSYTCERDILEIDINSIFFPHDSWVRPEAKNDYILAHEQLHFDITELYARKLRKALSDRIRDCSDTRKIDAVARGVLDQWKKVQNKYDSETHHSMHREEQEEWSREIARQLELHEGYTLSNWDGLFY